MEKPIKWELYITEIMPTYFEVARTEWLRNLGVTYKGLENNGIMLPVIISLSFNFLKSAKYDDLLSISVIFKKKPSSENRI